MTNEQKNIILKIILWNKNGQKSNKSKCITENFSFTNIIIISEV